MTNAGGHLHTGFASVIFKFEKVVTSLPKALRSLRVHILKVKSQACGT
jgi:hypothetical protein